MSEDCFNFLQLFDGTRFDLDQLSNRQKIEIIEWHFLNQCDNIADELPLRHYFYAGIYARELTIPKGVMLTGKVHNYPHLTIVSAGDISVMCDNGMTRIKAPYTFESKAGIKRIGYAHEDTVFTTLHATNSTNIDEIEQELFYDSDLEWVNQILLLP